VTDGGDVREELDRIRAENEQLRAEVDRLRPYRTAVQGQATVGGYLAYLGVLVWIGKDLSAAFRQWLQATRSGVGVPIDETAELLAAITRRLIRVGTIALVLALLPSFFVALQSWLIKKQNSLIAQQNASLINQIAEQRSAAQGDQITRHMEMLLDGEGARFWAAVSYFNSDAELRAVATKRLAQLLAESDGDAACTALAALIRVGTPTGQYRSVADMVRPFAPDRIKSPQFGRALRGGPCREIRFESVSLRGLNLYGSEFAFGTFSNVDLTEGALEGALLPGALFERIEAGAYLHLTGSDLRFAVFRQPRLPLDVDAFQLQGTLFTWPLHSRTTDGLRGTGGICAPQQEAEECYLRRRLDVFGDAQSKQLLDEFVVTQHPAMSNRGPSSMANCPTPLRGPIVSVSSQLLSEELQSCRRAIQ
jgi:hypothetical protein